MILRAIRHFCLLCISIQHFIMCFSMCSSASFVLLLMYSIQSSSFSVASISSSASSWKDTSLSWSLFEFCSEPSSVSLSVVPSSSFPSAFSVPSSFLFAVTFSVCIYFRLYNQAKHLSLRGLDHLIVFQRQCPRAAGISHRRCYHHAEKAKSVTEAVVFRRQFLAIFVERWPRCFQSVFDCLCFLFFERDLLSKVSRAGCFSKISILMLSTVISFALILS